MSCEFRVAARWQGASLAVALTRASDRPAEVTIPRIRRRPLPPLGCAVFNINAIRPRPPEKNLLEFQVFACLLRSAHPVTLPVIARLRGKSGADLRPLGLAGSVSGSPGPPQGGASTGHRSVQPLAADLEYGPAFRSQRNSQIGHAPVCCGSTIRGDRCAPGSPRIDQPQRPGRDGGSQVR